MADGSHAVGDAAAALDLAAERRVRSDALSEAPEGLAQVPPLLRGTMPAQPADTRREVRHEPLVVPDRATGHLRGGR